jgi:hypothetical protein
MPIPTLTCADALAHALKSPAPSVNAVKNRKNDEVRAAWVTM